MKRKQRRKTVRCGYIMNCPNRGVPFFKIKGRPAYRCTWCSLTMSA